MHPSSSHTKKNEPTNPNDCKNAQSVLSPNVEGSIGYIKLANPDFFNYLLRRKMPQPLAQVKAFIHSVNQKKWLLAEKLYRDNDSFGSKAFTHPALQKQLSLVMSQFKEFKSFRRTIKWYGDYTNSHEELQENILYDLAVAKKASSLRYYREQKYEKAIIIIQQAFNAILSMQVWAHSLMLNTCTSLSLYLSSFAEQCIQDAEKANVTFKSILDVIEGVDNAWIGEGNKDQIRRVMLEGLADCQMDLAIKYYYIKEYKKAIVMYQNAASNAKLIDDKELLEGIYNNLLNFQYGDVAGKSSMSETLATTTTTLVCSSSKKQQLEGLNQPAQINPSEKEEKEDVPKEPKSNYLFQKPAQSTALSETAMRPYLR